MAETNAVAELRDDLYDALRQVNETTDRIERALRAYADGAMVGPTSARGDLCAELDRR